MAENVCRYNCPSTGQYDWPDQYSPSANLFFTTSEKAIKNLFHNQDKIPYGTLVGFFTVYFLLACWTYGIGVPSGLFVPSLLTGAAFGRLVGHVVQDYIYPDIDAGIYALVGAASFLAGMARITISLTVILMECSRSVQNGLPIMLTVMFAKWVGDIFNVGLYDIHIELEHVPFLEPFPEDEHHVLQVHEVMSRPVNIPIKCQLQELISVLSSTEHSTFPVVNNHETQLFRGVIRRDYLCGILKAGQKNWEEFIKTESDGPDPPMVEVHDLMRLYPCFPSVEEATEAWYEPTAHGAFVVDLSNYVNPEPYTIGHKACLARAYRLFRQMGLRCLPVTNGQHQVAGVLTRQDFTHHSLAEGLGRAESMRPDEMELARHRLENKPGEKLSAKLFRKGNKTNLLSRAKSAPIGAMRATSGLSSSPSPQGSSGYNSDPNPISDSGSPV